MEIFSNGWSTNSGDPNSEGEWEGEGYEGVMVRDEDEPSYWAFVGGTWRQLS